jgi:hypothetical protein
MPLHVWPCVIIFCSTSADVKSALALAATCLMSHQRCYQLSEVDEQLTINSSSQSSCVTG